MNQNEQHIELISKFFAGECNAQEEVALQAWVNAAPENKKLLEEYREIWGFADQHFTDQAINVEWEWDKFKANIAAEETPVISINPLKRMMRLAAMWLLFILPLGALTFYFMNPKQEVILASNTTIEQDLPDGSIISLNKNSQLTYTNKFGKKKREVSLKGDAFFDIASDKQKPFIIDAGEVSIKVVGTAFYVNNREEEENIEVVVSEGIVEVKSANDMKRLVAGDKATFSKKDGQLIAAKNGDVNFLSWKTKKLIFKEDQLKKVVKTLNKVYQSKVEVDPSIENCKITATFDQQDLDGIITVIMATFNIESRQEEDKIILSGNACE